MAKLYRLIPAIVVSIAAFFELCLTGRACGAWKMARLDSRALSQNGHGAGTADFTSISPRPGIIVFRTGRVSHSSPPDPALKISRLIGVGKYMAMLIFLVFCIYVTCPSGQSLAEDGGGERIAEQSAPCTATDGQTSAFTRREKIVGGGLVALSIIIVACTYCNGLRKEKLTTNRHE